jgi:glycerate kinase
MQVLIAPNAFKNCMKAMDVAQKIAEGFEASRLQCDCHLLPIADGGDGTRALLSNSLGGQIIRVEVQGPMGKMLPSCFTFEPQSKTAIIEMAESSGIQHLSDAALNPLRANSFGTGTLIQHALNKGARKIILGLGGSASIDVGAGLLNALGFRFMNGKGESLHATPVDLLQLECIDLTAADPRLAHTEIVVLCDVDNNLSGPEGAIEMFGPQKGIRFSDIPLFETFFQKMRYAILNLNGRDINEVKHGGAAGGVAASLYAILNAQLNDGADYFLKLVDFDSALGKSNCLITGEGSIDEQTLKGKGPAGAAARAKKMNIPVLGLAGKLPLSLSDEFFEYFDALWAIGNEPSSLQSAYESTSANLFRTAFSIGNLMAATWNGIDRY